MGRRRGVHERPAGLTYQPELREPRRPGPEALAQVLVTRYPAGSVIGWHRNAPAFGPTVVGLSLGSA